MACSQRAHPSLRVCTLIMHNHHVSIPGPKSPRTGAVGLPEGAGGCLHHLRGAEGHDDGAQDDANGLHARPPHRVPRVQLRDPPGSTQGYSQDLGLRSELGVATWNRV